MQGSPRVAGGHTLPDLTLPLVDMAEMDKPVMVVTVTDIRMMSHVRAVGRGNCFVPASPPAPQTPLHCPTLNAASISTPSRVLWATASLVPPSCPRCAVAPTNSSLGSDPGQAQVEDDSPDVQHAADLGGQREGPAISVWAPGVGWGHTGSPAPLSENQPNTEGRELFRVQTLVKKKQTNIYI